MPGMDADCDGTLTSDDCDDSDSSIYPGAEELCDGIDSDCDGEEDPACDEMVVVADFTTCGATGNTGPSQPQCDDEYFGSELAVEVIDGIQAWTVPGDGEYTITAVGARGASGDTEYLGGLGAEVTGTFALTEGTVLYIAVGQQGSGQSSASNGGGGGGSWVVQEGDTPLVIAGGGGGTREAVLQDGCDATTSEYGVSGSGSLETWSCGDRTGVIGTGGIVSGDSWGSGGGGLETNGGSDYGTTSGGSSWFNGLSGGYPVDGAGGCSDTAAGGFGGGGSGQGCHGGGGGGGYSGGDGGRVAGGGGSYNAGTESFSLTGMGDGHGYVIIEGTVLSASGGGSGSGSGGEGGVFGFTTCGAGSQNGPTQDQCDEEYLGTTLEGWTTVTGGIQQWVAPVDGEYMITAVGARGASGDSGYLGGLGVEMTGTFLFTEGTVLYIAVGQQGSGQSSGSNGGGGGGSWVVQEGDIPLVIAGGGGGTREEVLQDGCDATTSAYGVTGSASIETWSCAERTGVIGTGGIVSGVSWGSGGGGLETDGAAEYGDTNGGSSWFNGLNGGYSPDSCGDTAAGGFGGGGSGQGCHGGGGGGGYSGGDGGRVAGGGGSYNAGAEPFSLIGVGDGHGFVIIDATAL
jgi:hypothetical protein